MIKVALLAKKDIRVVRTAKQLKMDNIILIYASTNIVKILDSRLSEICNMFIWDITNLIK